MFGLVIQVITHGIHFLSLSLVPFTGDDDNLPVVAVEWDPEGSEGEALLSTGAGLAEAVSHPWSQLPVI